MKEDVQRTLKDQRQRVERKTGQNQIGRRGEKKVSVSINFVEKLTLTLTFNSDDIRDEETPNFSRRYLSWASFLKDWQSF